MLYFLRFCCIARIWTWKWKERKERMERAGKGQQVLEAQASSDTDRRTYDPDEDVEHVELDRDALRNGVKLGSGAHGGLSGVKEDLLAVEQDRSRKDSESTVLRGAGNTRARSDTIQVLRETSEGGRTRQMASVTASDRTAVRGRIMGASEVRATTTIPARMGPENEQLRMFNQQLPRR